MNAPSRSTAGASSRAASSRSFSRNRVIPDGLVVRDWGSATTPAALPAPPEIGFFTSTILPVDLLELVRGPLHRVLGLALHTLGEHVDDDVLRVDLGGLGRRRPGEADDPRVVRCGAEALHRRID